MDVSNIKFSDGSSVALNYHAGTMCVGDSDGDGAMVKLDKRGAHRLHMALAAWLDGCSPEIEAAILRDAICRLDGAVDNGSADLDARVLSSLLRSFIETLHCSEGQ